MTRPTFRFAPSPNGSLHLGHALSALLNADMAARAGGRLLLRIEDIDTARCTPDLESGVLRDLAWLGFRWETPVRRQSEHFPEYRKLLRTLIDDGLVYPGFMSRGEIKAHVAARGSDEPWPCDPEGAPLYPGVDKALDAGERDRRIAAGEPFAWRLDMEKALKRLRQPLSWREFCDPDMSLAENIPARPRDWGDVVLARRDVPTSYHLSVVADDALQGVTHVVRGRDLFHATAVQRLLQELLGLPAPRYFHHRLILGADGRKLSKSAGDSGIEALRSAGRTPREIREIVGL